MTPTTPHAQKLAPLQRLVTLPVSSVQSFLRKMEDSDVAATPGAATVRRFVAVILGAYAGVLVTLSVVHGGKPGVSELLIGAIALAVYKNMLGRFLRDWTLVFACLFAYLESGRWTHGAHALIGIHYRPQLEADKIIGFGQVPAVWLQQHLYGVGGKPLAIFTTLMYLSHFIAPLVLGLIIWFMGKRRAFGELMFAILLTCILADITFVLAPTAPPWLAAEHGYLPPLHHVLKDGLQSMHMSGLAQMDHDGSRYNIVAAIPSLHMAFPVAALLVLIRHRMPRWLVFAQGFQAAGVLFAIVYSGEHYVIDAVVGGSYAALALFLVSRMLERASKRKVGAKEAGAKGAHVPAPVPAAPDRVL